MKYYFTFILLYQKDIPLIINLMFKILFISIVLFTTGSLYSQYKVSNFDKSPYWKHHKHEFFFNIGATGFLGDVGGLDKAGTNNSPVDLDFKSIRYTGGIGYRLRFSPRFAYTSTLAYAQFSGKDEYTQEIIRNSRNLSFRTHALDLGQRLEFIIFAKENISGSMANAANAREHADLLYLFGGVNGFLFIPQANLNGKWTNLRPLKTEGQGLPDGAKEYGLFNFGIPVGIGYRFGLAAGWRLGFELSYTKTFTDYLDDVSTVYYDPIALQTNIGDEAVYAANPAKANHDWFTAGQQRGNDEDKDAYLYFNITVTYNITNYKYRPGRGFNSRSKF